MSSKGRFERGKAKVSNPVSSVHLLESIPPLFPEGAPMGINGVSFTLGELQEGIKRHGCPLQPGKGKLLQEGLFPEHTETTFMGIELDEHRLVSPTTANGIEMAVNLNRPCCVDPSAIQPPMLGLQPRIGIHFER